MTMDATAIERKRDELQAIIRQTGNQSGWEETWKQGITPWEMALGNVAQPGLRWVFEAEHSEPAFERLPKTGKVLVPGCGRGQDVAYFALRGFSATGIDISATAVKAAQAWLAQQAAEQEGSDSLKTHASVIQADYFDLDAGPGVHPTLSNVDLIYDYTFFCAIPPELHAKWANSHAAALKPGGILLCLVFPIRLPDSSGKEHDEHGKPIGPPFAVTPQLYTSLLQDRFTLLFDGVAEGLPQHKVGRERVMIWQRK